MKKENRIVFSLTASAAMIALSVILCRLLGFASENTPFRLGIDAIPIALTGYMFGPVFSGVANLIADVIGSLFSGYAPNPWISLCKLASGGIFGAFFYKKKLTLARIIIAFSTVAVFIEFLAMAPIFIHLYGYTATFAFGARAINAFANLPIRILLFYLLFRGINAPLSKLLRKYGFDTKKDNEKKFTEFANSFQTVTVPGLERVGALCTKLGNPERSLKFIHVAGTNGKGSVSAYTERILSAAGYKVGKYISPNLVKVNERISVAGEDISDEDLQTILDKIEPLCTEVEQECGIAPTQFEIWTAAAFVHFRDTGCDFVVLEVGLGGEFDATNVIPTNEIQVITRLGIDHTAYLGNTIEKIAAAKAGIIKESSRTKCVVTVRQDPSALDVIKRMAAAKGSSVSVVDPLFERTEGTHEVFSMDGLGDLVCGISGYHQIENAALAVRTALTLGIDEASIRKGLLEARNPARFEVVSEEPTVIFDGGHNENGIAALTSSLKRYFPNQPKTVLFACMHDKEITESLKALSEGETTFVFTTVKDNPRAETAAGLAGRAHKIGISGDYFDDFGEAYERAVGYGNLTVICGSLYLYKDYLEYINERG